MIKSILSKISGVIKSQGAGNVWLIIFFIIQTIYVALCVFMPLPDGDEKSVLDVVSRTAAAVLAGYFLSKNFSAVPKNVSKNSADSIRRTMQINIAGVIGLFSLCLITVIRYVETTALPYNVISQLRDFYLAAIAFLMGTGE